MTGLVLVSHALCPYVQRVAIALAETGVAHERRVVDLAAKPDWFLAMSPLGKTPVLMTPEGPVFESAVILDYLEEAGPGGMLPAAPYARARVRGWVEVASAVLADIAGLYGAVEAGGAAAREAALRAKFAQVEAALGAGPWFDGARFGLVDAAFAPVFRYLGAFARLGVAEGLADGLPKIGAWRVALAGRPSVRGAVGPDFDARLDAFLRGRQSWLGRMLAA